jgi:hypothetical protein
MVQTSTYSNTEGDTVDDEEFSFISLAALTANVVLWLSQKKVDGAHEDAGQPDERDDEHADRKLAVVRRD